MHDLSASSDDLQNAVDNLPATGAELCLAAAFTWSPSVQIKARSRIVVTGAGPASIIRASGHEAALLLDTSDEIEIRNIRVEGGTPSPGGDPALNGAITVTGSSRVRIADCTVACPGAQAVRNQTCITARSGSGRNVQDLRLERNALEIGPWQTGILIVDADSARVSGNRLSLPPGIGVSALTGADELVVRLTRNLVTAAIAAAASAATKQVPIPGASPINVVVGSDAEKLIDALAPKLAPSQVARRGVAGALGAAVRRAVSPEGFASLPNSAQVVITGVRQGLLSAGQGIVVGGSRAGTIQIHDNVVEDTVEGIHVGALDAEHRRARGSRRGRDRQEPHPPAGAEAVRPRAARGLRGQRAQPAHPRHGRDASSRREEQARPDRRRGDPDPRRARPVRMHPAGEPRRLLDRRLACCRSGRFRCNGCGSCRRRRRSGRAPR